MLGTPKMTQKTGDNTVNFQVAGDFQAGLSYGDVKGIFIDLFNDNFIKLSEDAKLVALQRAEDLVSDFISKAESKVADVQVFAEPNFQHAIYKAQVSYAKIGEAQFKERIVDILLERANEKERSSKQIILEEIIDILPKLTDAHINYLSLLFSIVGIRHNNLLNIVKLKEIIDTKIGAFYSKEVLNDNFISYLEYIKAISLLPEGATYKPIEELFLYNYKGIFSNGFTQEEFEKAIGESIVDFQFLLIPCLHNRDKLQINCMDESIIKNKLQQHNQTNVETKICSLFSKSTMTVNEVFNYLSSLNVDFAKLMTKWKTENANIKALQLTPVGKIIAILNYNRVMGANFDIDAFI